MLHKILVWVGSFVSRSKTAFRRKYWRWMVEKNSASCGEGLHVNARTAVTGNTYLGSHVNFNGMEISGGGW